MIKNYYSTDDTKTKHANISLFPAILDVSPFSRNTHSNTDSSPSTEQRPPLQHRRPSLFSRCSSKSTTTSTSHADSPRRYSHSSEATSSEEHHRHSSLRRKLSLPHPDLGALAMKYLAPTTYMSVSPTHERVPEFEDSGRRSSSVKGKEKARDGIMRADEVHVEAEDGAPLCREAEIEKWKGGRNASAEVGTEARWALYW